MEDAYSFEVDLLADSEETGCNSEEALPLITRKCLRWEVEESELDVGCAFVKICRYDALV